MIQRFDRSNDFEWFAIVHWTNWMLKLSPAKIYLHSNRRTIPLETGSDSVWGHSDRCSDSSVVITGLSEMSAIIFKPAFCGKFRMETSDGVYPEAQSRTVTQVTWRSVPVELKTRPLNRSGLIYVKFRSRFELVPQLIIWIIKMIPSTLSIGVPWVDMLLIRFLCLILLAMDDGLPNLSKSNQKVPLDRTNHLGCSWIHEEALWRSPSFWGKFRAARPDLAVKWRTASDIWL